MYKTKIIELAKEAYTLSAQLREMQKSMEREGSNDIGYHAFARTYTKHLARAKEILELDPTIASTISQLVPYDSNKEQDYFTDFEQMKADIPILRSALRSFFVFNFRKEEKDRIGFIP